MNKLIRSVVLGILGPLEYELEPHDTLDAIIEEVKDDLQAESVPETRKELKTALAALKALASLTTRP